MASASGFRGWSEDVITFYRGLEADNSRTFWQANKATYDTCVRGPMEALITTVDRRFQPLKTFRPNRDVRFSKDKDPIKDHQGAVVMIEDAIGYYVQVSGSGLMVAPRAMVRDLTAAGEELRRQNQRLTLEGRKAAEDRK